MFSDFKSNIALYYCILIGIIMINQIRKTILTPKELSQKTKQIFTNSVCSNTFVTKKYDTVINKRF